MKRLFIIVLCICIFSNWLSAQVTIIPFNDTWKYLDNGTNQGTAWRAVSFNDATWKSGTGKLGYGAAYINTTVSYGSNASKKYITTYFRKSVTISNPSAYTHFSAFARRDDGLVIYVNGTEVYRNNMSAGIIGSDSLATVSASDDGLDAQFFNINSAAFVAGNNVIAAEVHQQKANSGDLAFDLKLTTPDVTAPSLLNSVRQVPLTTAASSAAVTFRVAFSEAVTGVSRGDFTLTTTGTATGTLPTNAVIMVDEQGSVYDVTVSSITGLGTLRLNLKASGTGIADLTGNSIPNVAFTGGQTYTIDRIAPGPVSINRQSPAESNTASFSLTWQVTFSEAVIGVNVPDFSLETLSGSAAGNIAEAIVQAVTSTVYNITVNDISGAGVLRLNLNSGSDITDIAGNLLSAGLTTGQTYNVDRIQPFVNSINRQLPATAITAAPSVTYRVIFSEQVSGVDLADFLIATTGTASGILAANAVTQVGTGGTTYDISITGVTGEGTISLQLLGSGTGINDFTGNGISAGFTTGETYQVDRIAPSVISINRLLPATGLTNAVAVTYRVIFSESISGLAPSNFNLFTSGSAAGTLDINSITSIGTGGATYDVVVGSLNGTGVLRLDLASGVGVLDIVGNEVATFNAGQSYTIDRNLPYVVSINRSVPVAQNTSATTVTYRIVFSEPVAAVGATDFMLTTVSGSTTGIIADEISSVGTDGTTYDIIINSITGAGQLRLDLKSGIDISDPTGNNIEAGYISGQHYDIEDDIPPSILSINRQLPLQEITNAGTLVMRIVFSESVTGVDASDFTIVTTGTAAGIIVPTAITQITEDSYDLAVTSVTGDGTLSVSINTSGTGILDLLGNGLIAGSLSTQSFQVDHTSPAVISSFRQIPLEETTGVEQLTWRITFSEPVTALNPADFTIHTINGSVGGMLELSGIVPVGIEGNLFDITVINISGTGSLRLHVNSNGSAMDIAGNGVDQQFVTGESYNLSDETPPIVVNIKREYPATALAATSSVTWRIAFSEAVTGFDVTDLVLSVTEGAITGSFNPDAITASGTEGTDFLVTWSNISGLGQVRLDILNTGTGITDIVSNPIAGGFTEGEGYFIDRESPVVTNITRLLPATATTAANAVTFRILFSEAITGIDATDFTLYLTGDATGNIQSITPVPGIINSYDIVIDNITGNGIVRVDLKELGTGITDILGNAILQGFVTGEFFTIDQIPFVRNINRQFPAFELTSAASVTYRIIFSEPVLGVNASDFTLSATSGSASGVLDVNAVVAVGTDGTTYDVTAISVSGLGNLKLNLNNNETGITDNIGNVIGGGFTNGQTYSIDRLVPAMLSINRKGPLNEIIIASAVTWRVIFSEPVTGVTTNDFTLTATGSAFGNLGAGAVIAVGTEGTTYDVTADGLAGAGTLRLDLKSTNTYIMDIAGNQIGGAFTSGEFYNIDLIAPAVASILRYLPTSNGTTDTVVTYRVTFTEAVSGVSAADFSLTNTGSVTAVVAPDAVTMVGTSGTLYDVKVSAITGVGSLRLDLKNTGTGILDLAGNAISGGFTSGQLYTIDQSPIIVSINRQIPLPANSSDASLTFRVTFSKKVTGVDINDFVVKQLTGTARGTLILLTNEPSGTVAQDAVKSVGATGAIYDVTVRAVNGSGSLRLDVLPSGTGIKDVAGNSIRTGFTTGETYNVVPAGTEGFTSFSEALPLAISSHTGEKPQAKSWTYAGKWWSVLATSSGTKIFRLDGNQWIETLVITSHGSTKNDCIVVGDVTHILTFRTGNNDSYIISVEYNPLTNKYQLWNKRKTKIPLQLGSDTETATMAMDGNGRMWVANDGTTDISVRWSDAPYSVWSAPFVIANGITTDDISAIVSMPGKIGVLWSNQNTQRFGFRTHTNGAAPMAWSTEESPASQSAQNIGLGFSDDHLNVLCGTDGTLYCAIKTSYETLGVAKVALLIRRPSGTWDDLYPVTSNEGTRAIVLLNEAAQKIRIAYSSLENGGDILYRESSLTTISFGRPFTLFGGDPGFSYNYITSTHQVCNSEVVIIATDQRVGVDYAVTIIASDGIAPPPTTAPTSNRGNIEIAATDNRMLLNAYPNPFDNKTSVQITLPEDGQYSLVLYNSLGVQLSVLSEGKAVAGQQKTVTINSNKLASGMYVLRLQMAQNTKTIKLIRR